VGQSLWFASRATGLVSLPLLTASMVLGIAGAGRFASARWPRFTLAALHRNVSMLTVLFLLVHIVTAVVDPYAKIEWIDTVVPFVSSYQPFWLGLGAVAFDLIIALIVTSVLRLRIAPRTWRLVHWTSYACWPVGLVHGLGTSGGDADETWVIALNIVCALAVLASVAWRVSIGAHPDQARRAAAVGGR
jgi:methionine sulfoxide reductase heme-binding subunit